MKIRNLFLPVFFSVLVLASCKQAASNEKNESKNLEMGFSSVDISGDSAVILDPLHVKAVVFRQGDEKIALVECDVTEISAVMTRPAREQAARATGIPFNKITVAATHTHMSRPHKDLGPAIVKAVTEAQSSLRPVTITSAIGQQFNVSFNRRYFMKDGTVVFNPMFLNPDIVRPAGPIDPEVGIVMFSDESTKKPVTCMVNFALHLDIVKEYGAVYQQSGPGSRNSVSADYPYWLDKSLKKEFGDGFNSIFFTGCCGNINHWDFSKAGPQSGHATKSKEVGDSLFGSVMRALPKGSEQKPALASRSVVINVPLQTFTDNDYEWAKGVSTASLSGKSEEPNERMQFLNNVKRERILWLHDQKVKGIVSMPFEVQAFRLSDKTAIVTLPGEMFVEYGLAIKNFSPFENTMVIELANDGPSYVPNRKAFSQGGYEVENSRLMPGGGEMLAQAAIAMLKDLKSESPAK